MRYGECHREREVIEAVFAGRWPGAVGAGLREHVAGCETCATTVRLAAALGADRDLAITEACPVPSGVMWWRAEIRARHEAARLAARPINAALVLTAVALVGIGVAFAGMVKEWLGVASAWIGTITTSSGILTDASVARAADAGLASVVPVQTALWVAVAVWFILTPVAVYLVVADD